MTPLQIREIFGNPKPPTKVWERQFDGFDDRLAEIGQMDWKQIEEGDLWYYIHDLAYMELQPDLFNHLFPVCLNFWRDSLMRNDDAARGDAEFHYALIHGEVLKKMVKPEQREAIHGFFCDAFMERLNCEPWPHTSDSPSQAWMFRFNSIGLSLRIIEHLWSSWWLFDTPGKAACAVMWASGLIYETGDNPMYGTTDHGGPFLTENDSMIYDQSWLPENRYFLASTLNPEYIQSKLILAAAVLKGRPGHDLAIQCANDATQRTAFLAKRIDDLIEELGTTSMDKIDGKDTW